ncbi:MAG: NAD(P)/FAD-dependent oxidoreductase [Desulfobulbus sp.]|nr:NAD(P)/FAD-dependent oxidoreductase [Desulfobulbus sp.]
MERADVLVVGGGPGGLACATLLAQKGVKVVLIERKPVIGPKVCAGGITWHGLINLLPETLIERAFPEQSICSDRQHLVIRESNPIIATISRENLGQWMAKEAQKAGVCIRTATRLITCTQHEATVETEGRGQMTLHFSHLVGADGANSRVRKLLAVPTELGGLGLNAMIDGSFPRMEWHLRPALFGSGYAWIFPHADKCSVGAYADQSLFSATHLKTQLLHWCGEQKLSLEPGAIRAGLVNYDYRGVRFAKGFLVGDAAGLASGLTGEGIYPALISGQVVARMILDPHYPALELKRLVRRHQQHRQMVQLAGRYPRLGSLLTEALLVLLRWHIIDFHKLEMAD